MQEMSRLATALLPSSDLMHASRVRGSPSVRLPFARRLCNGKTCCKRIRYLSVTCSFSDDVFQLDERSLEVPWPLVTGARHGLMTRFVTLATDSVARNRIKTSFDLIQKNDRKSTHVFM